MSQITPSKSQKRNLEWNCMCITVTLWYMSFLFCVGVGCVYLIGGLKGWDQFINTSNICMTTDHHSCIMIPFCLKILLTSKSEERGFPISTAFDWSSFRFSIAKFSLYEHNINVNTSV